ncbi:MAG: peptidoglycan DD-metalloendopeptidase family protein [Micromonosporaceae bacterium]|nr:peptidoglycan DD-metalloendopeptidase family protein [Micromonosporaceae bacterium]
MVALGTASAMPSNSSNSAAYADDPALDPASAGADGLDADRGNLADRASRSGRSATLPKGKRLAPRDIWVLPVKKYNLTSLYGARWGTTHRGIDLAGPYGTPVHAAHEGTVVRAGWYGGYGYAVDIDHGGGVVTRYGHNSAVTVSVGQYVRAGQQIAKMGSTGYSTGNHSHFEVRIGDEAINPIPYLLQRGVDIQNHKDSIYIQ